MLQQRRRLLSLPFAALGTAVSVRTGAAATPGPRTPDSAASRATPAVEVAILAGGCFWALQAVLDRGDGVIATTTGFTGGHTRNPTYDDVVAGGTGHLEAVKVEFDPRRVSFSRLLDVFWRNIDPTRVDEQFCDIGRQYNPTVFHLTEAQLDAALASQAGL